MDLAERHVCSNYTANNIKMRLERDTISFEVVEQVRFTGDQRALVVVEHLSVVEWELSEGFRTDQRGDVSCVEDTSSCFDGGNDRVGRTEDSEVLALPDVMDEVADGVGEAERVETDFNAVLEQKLESLKLL